MPEGNHTVTVAKDLEDLIPTYLKNRHKEVETLRIALSAGDYEQIRQLGHRMRGVGTSYGFEKVTVLGKQIEDGAKSADRAAIESHIAAYADYLSRVKVVYA